MANRKQILINFHSSGKTSQLPVAELQYGEIAVRHHSEKPELYIKTGADAYATFIDSAKTQGMITTAVDGAKTTLQNNIDAVSTALTAASANIETTINTLETKVDTLSGNVETTLAGYVTTGALDTYKGEVTNAISGAKNEAIGAASAYTDSKVSDVQTTLESKINTASANIETTIVALAERVDGVEENYVKTTDYTAYTAATKTAYEKAASDAKDAAIAAVSGYANTSIEVLKTNLEGQIGDVDDRVDNLSGVVETHINGMTTTLAGYVTTGDFNTYKEDVVEDIAEAKDAAIGAASAYTDTKVGAVQNSLDSTNTALGTLSGRVDTLVGEDGDKSARAIAAEEAAAAVKLVVSGAPQTFDTLKEVADWIETHSTSAATMVSDINELKSGATSANTRLTNLENDLDGAEANIKALSGAVETKYATSAATVAAIEAVNNRFDGYATSADTVAAIEAVNNRFDGYATSADTVAAISAEATARQNADDALGSRISELEKVSGATSSAVQTIVVENSENNNIIVEKSGTTVTFNFDNMVIDGGTF